MTLDLHGYRYSVYSWIARFALEEKRVDYRWIEVNPFAPDVPEDYLTLHPFKRVPALVDGSFRIYETGAITRYVDEAFPGPDLQPPTPQHRARMNQLISVVDSYVYWPFVRQVFSHRVFRPRLGRTPDLTEIDEGLQAAAIALAAMERLAAEAPYLCGPEMSLADIHLAPMIGYFAMAEEGAGLLQWQPKLSRWWSTISARPSYLATRPQLP
jgi:glutathione S-transferase